MKCSGILYHITAVVIIILAKIITLVCIIITAILVVIIPIISIIKVCTKTLLAITFWALGCYAEQWLVLTSQQLVCLWMGFISQLDNASHSQTSCAVFQRFSPCVSSSSSLPTLGCTQECDTLPDKQTQTKWVYMLSVSCEVIDWIFPVHFLFFSVWLKVWGTGTAMLLSSILQKTHSKTGLNNTDLLGSLWKQRPRLIHDFANRRDKHNKCDLENTFRNHCDKSR